MTILITFLFKKFQGQDILDVCKFLGGNTLTIIMGILYILLLLLVPIFVVKNFSEALQVIYFKTSPLIFILLFFIISSTIANKFSLKVLAKANLIITPIIFFSIIIILFSSFKNFNVRRIFPILGYGVNQTFFSGLSNVFSFSGIGYLFFIGPFINNAKDFKKMSIISIVLSGLYLFLSVTCILLSLSPTFKSEETFSLYLLTRNLSYGRFIQRVDAIFIFLWIISVITYISFAIYFAIYIFKKLTKISDTSSINYTINLLVLTVLLIPSSLAVTAQIAHKTFKIGTLIFLFGISIIILILANLKLKIIDKKKGKV